MFRTFTHGLRRGLHYVAASRLSRQSQIFASSLLFWFGFWPTTNDQSPTTAHTFPRVTIETPETRNLKLETLSCAFFLSATFLAGLAGRSSRIVYLVWCGNSPLT